MKRSRHRRPPRGKPGRPFGNFDLPWSDVVLIYFLNAVFVVLLLSAAVTALARSFPG